jgi:hypothetical protein
MKLKLFTLAIVSVTWFGCNNPKNIQTENNTTTQEQFAEAELDDAQHKFVLDLSNTYPKPFLVLNAFRNRYISKSELKGYHKFLEKYPKITFDTTFLLNKELELSVDTNVAHPNLFWVNEKDIRTCKDVLRDMWPCFKNRYQHNAFYYLSVPVFSADGKYALVSLNYVNANDDESFGGLRVFELNKNKWEEFAILTNWGAN